MDNLYYYLISEDWKDNKKKAIIQFIISWYTDDCDKKEIFLKKSIEYYSKDKYIFIEEYILGIRLSEENFDSINKKIEQTNERI